MMAEGDLFWWRSVLVIRWDSNSLLSFYYLSYLFALCAPALLEHRTPSFYIAEQRYEQISRIGKSRSIFILRDSSRLADSILGSNWKSMWRKTRQWRGVLLIHRKYWLGNVIYELFYQNISRLTSSVITGSPNFLESASTGVWNFQATAITVCCIIFWKYHRNVIQAYAYCINII